MGHVGATFMGYPQAEECLQATVIKTLAKSEGSCNHSLLPLKRAEQGVSAQAEIGFGLMFLSAVELPALKASFTTHSAE